MWGLQSGQGRPDDPSDNGTRTGVITENLFVPNGWAVMVEATLGEGVSMENIGSWDVQANAGGFKRVQAFCNPVVNEAVLVNQNSWFSRDQLAQIWNRLYLRRQQNQRCLSTSLLAAHYHAGSRFYLILYLLINLFEAQIRWQWVQIQLKLDSSPAVRGTWSWPYVVFSNLQSVYPISSRHKTDLKRRWLDIPHCSSHINA